jgi:hypothetical protein
MLDEDLQRFDVRRDCRPEERELSNRSLFGIE